MFEKLDESNFLLYAAKYYDNPQCHDIEEFYDDLKRFKYLKRLFGKYQETGELRERLILNHVTVLYNVFGEHATRMLFYKLSDPGYNTYLKPFILMLGFMPDRVYMGPGEVIHSSDIRMDETIVKALRKI